MDFQNVDIPAGALDTSTDPALLPTGALTLAENATIDTKGVYEKRRGYTAITSLSGIFRLAVCGAALLALDSTSCWSYNAATANWYNSGSVSSALTSQQAIALDQTQDLIVSTRATAGNVTAHFWIRNGTVYYELRSISDNAIMATAVADSSASFRIVHAVAVGQYIFAAWVDNATQVIRGVRVDSTTGSITAAATILSGANVFSTNPYLDVAPLSSTECYIAYISNTPNVKVNRFNVATFSITITSGNLSGADGIGAGTGLAVMGTAGEKGYVVYADNAGNVRATTWDPTSTILSSGPSTIYSLAGVAPRNVGLVRYDSTHALVVIDNVTATPRALAHWALIDSTAVLSSDVTIPGALLISKPWTYGGNFYVNLFASFTGTTLTAPQQTFFTVRIGTAPYVMVAAHAYRVAYATASTAAHLTDVDQPSAGVFAFDAPVAYKFLSTATARAAVYSFGVDFASATRGLPVEANGETYFANGVVKHYDGVRPIEANFLLYPVIISAGQGDNGAPGIADGAYSYIAVYETADANGNVDRSTTSVPAAVTVDHVGGGFTNGNGKVTVTITHLQMTSVGWTGQQQGNISLFRTKAGGTTYFYVGQAAMDPTAASVAIVDNLNDSAIGSNRILYTTGGVLDREPPPAAMQLIIHKNRIWGISSADRKTLFYSGELAVGEAAWFSSLQQIRLDVGGDITAIASLDDKLVVFKSDRIFKIYGSGGNALGQNSDLTIAAHISADCGCIDPRSVVYTPDGLMFLSAKGLQLLDRQEAVQFIGKNVKSTTDGYSNVVAAKLLPDRREVRFEHTTPIPPLVTPAGQKSVYNYNTRCWTTHRNYLDVAAIDAAMVGGTYYWATSSGAIYKESASSSLDPSSTYVSMAIEWGWNRIAGAQGLARCTGALVLADWRADHKLEVQVARNYLDVYERAVDYPRTTLNTLSVEQVWFGLKAQKAEAYRFRVTDYADGGSPGQGFAMRGLTLRAGAKKGSFKGLMQAGVKG